MKEIEKEADMIREEFQRLRDKMGETPERRSNRNFVGQVFASVVLKYIRDTFPNSTKWFLDHYGFKGWNGLSGVEQSLREGLKRSSIALPSGRCYRYL